ncbi:MAG: outer membrane beta-barrel family protein, partial [Flavitalea sp.]
TPGISVDKDGNINLKGKQGVMVLIDGRPTYLSGKELASFLKGMSSLQLEQIEIMTNPPAKYDAAGNSGIINIKTKKNKLKGLNGSVSLGYGQGKYYKSDQSLSLNYRNGKVNLFSNFSLGSNKYFQELSIYRRFKTENDNTRAVFEQLSIMKNTNSYNNAKIGMDYYVNKKTTLGVVFTGFYNPGKMMGNNTSYLKNAALHIDSIVISTSNQKDRWKNGVVNLNMRHYYDTAGRELSVDVDVIAYDVTNFQNFTNTSLTPAMIKQGEDNLIGDLPMKINIYSAKADYTHPLKKQAKIEAGWKSSYVITDSKAKYYNLIENEQQPDYTKTNFFRYRENVNAAYVNFSTPLSKKFTIQTGLRFENTNYTGLQHGNPTRSDSSFSKTYNGIFPTGYLSYNANKNNTFGFSIGRRIERPRYEDLNPFLFFIDRYTYGRGNPYLKPQYTNNVELSHMFKGIFTTTLNYSHTKQMFTEQFDQEGEYATVITNTNLGSSDNAGVAVSAQLNFIKWLSTNVYGNYNYKHLRGRLDNEDFDASAGQFSVNINNQFTFNKGWSAELSGWYNSKGIESQLIIKPMCAISAGVSKQVLKSKGSLRLSARDIFRTQTPKGNINFKDTEVHFQNKFDSRVVNLTFTYRFGKQFNTPQKKEHYNDEQNRVKGGR